MEVAKWVTKSGNISLIHELDYFEYQLQATGSVEFLLVSGELPPGIQLTNTGRLQGIPVVTTANSSDKFYQYAFTVRAKFYNNTVSDRTFELTVTGITPPQIISTSDARYGPYSLGDKVLIQLDATDSTPGDILEWELVAGAFPEGITMSRSGIVEGYVLQRQNIPLLNYFFTVQVSDGVNIDRKTFSILIDETQAITRPVLLTEQKEFFPVRHDNYYSFKFEAYDFDGDELEFFLLNSGDFGGDYSSGFDIGNFDQIGFDFTSGETLQQLIIDPVSGWLYGYLPNIGDSTKYYDFYVGVRKKFPPNTESKIKKLTLTVVPYEEDEISWVSNSFLGTLNNGEISDLQVFAKSFTGEPLVYSMVPYDPLRPIPTKFPQGLYLQDNGVIIGRTNFRYFSLNGGVTTIDGNSTTFDETYNFAIMAKNLSGTQQSIKVFSIRVRNRNIKPFENVFIKSLSTQHKRDVFDTLVQDQRWLPSEIVYRENDPYFGRVKKLSMLFFPGVEATALDDYAISTKLNHYRKTVYMDEIKVAKATDEDFNSLYEVIYLTVRDNMSTSDGGPPETVNLTTLVKYFYKIDDEEIKSLEANSYQNMKKRLYEKLELENRGVLPKWMTSVQDDGSVLGLIDAIPIAYVLPGTANIAVQNLRKTIDIDSVKNFTPLNFEFDRYHIDNYLSTYYDYKNQQFYSLPETTFDRYTRPDENTLTFEGYVDYALGVPFETVNNQNYYKILGGSNVSIVSDQTFRVKNSAWSDWMNAHAVWRNTGTRTFPNTRFTVERDFNVQTAGQYRVYLMNSHPAKVFINDAQILISDGVNITLDENNVFTELFLAQGINTIKMQMDIGSGSVIWSVNPTAISTVISNENAVVFDTALQTDAKVSYTIFTQRPGLDGESDIQTGKRLVFAIQDQYEDFAGDNHGWNDFSDLYGADYDALPYNDYEIVPGLYERALDPTLQTPNKRAGLWEVNIDSDFVLKLNFVKEVPIGNYFNVLRGETYGGDLVRLNTVPPLGRSELNYQVISEELTERRTKFDNNDTRFIEFRELYADPNRGDKYIVFPKIGIFE